MQRKLGQFDLTMIVVSLVIGMGIFRTPVLVAQSAVTEEVYYAAWIIGGIIALCGALTFAEIGSRLPVSGGYYRIFSHCYHPSVAFILNGTILVSNAASVAGVALIGSEYLGKVMFDPADPDLPAYRLSIAAGEILLFFGLNLLGLKTSARTQNVLTVFKIGIVLLICLAIFNPSKEFLSPEALQTVPKNYGWLAITLSIGACLIPISFTYGGYQQTINFGSDVENPTRTMPRGIIWGIVVVVVLYLLINYAYINVIQFENLGSRDGIATTMAGKVLGGLGSKIFTFVFFLAVLAYVNVGLMSNPRVIVAMSEEGILPRFFARKDTQRDVPVNALVVFTAMSLLVLFFAKAFDQIVSYVIFLDSLGLVAAASTVFILRNRGTGDTLNPYRMKLFPVATIFFMLAYLFVTFSIIYEKPFSALYGCGVVLFFLLVYLLLRIANRNA
jgi:basic amino acid/polyamine antiporter, APA family